MEKSNEPITENVEVVLADDASIPKINQHIKTYEKIPWHQSARENPFALAWCCYMLFTCFMVGYDGLASAVVISIGRFRQDYGYAYEGQYVVSAAWQLGFTGASLFGQIIGGLGAGVIGKYYGQKISIGLSYLLTISGVFLQWYSPGSLPMFLGGKILTGTPLGCFVTVAPIYCSEVAPPPLRGTMIAAVNWSQVVGQLLAFGVMRQTQALDSSMSYRILFAVQWGFAAVALAVLPFCPESPFRLAARSKDEAARKSIRRLYPHLDVETKLRDIHQVLAHNASQAALSGSFMDCFNSKNRTRTLVALSVFVFQASSGVAWVIGYVGYFLQLGGMNPSAAFNFSVGIAGLMAIGNMIGWVFVERAGRRTTIFGGMIICTTALLIIGILSLFISKGSGIIYTQAACMAMWGFAYQGSIGGAGYTLVAEVPTSSLRSHTQSLATVVAGFSFGTWSLVLPYMVNPDEGNMGGKVAFVFFALSVIATIVIFFYYPETKGRSFEEIDELYDRGISARHFAKTRLD